MHKMLRVKMQHYKNSNVIKKKIHDYHLNKPLPILKTTSLTFKEKQYKL